MRRAAKADANQPAVVRALRAVGASVEHLHRLGQGIPDLLVGYRGRNTLLEVKDGAAPPSRRKLTPDEQDWHDAWRGQVVVVESPEEALRAIGALPFPSSVLACSEAPERHRLVDPDGELFERGGKP